MIGLIDLDSILFYGVYKCVSIAEMRDAIEKYGIHSAKEWLLEESANRSAIRVEDFIVSIEEFMANNFNEEVFLYETFVTKCPKSFRKTICKDYKANRKRNKYVEWVREYFIEQGAIHSEYFEADDLIADRAKELNGNCIVISIDKDMKQLGGWYWSYQKTEVDGEKVFKNDIEFIEKSESEKFFWTQMLQGDAGDGVKGIKGVGKVKAAKIINASPNPFIAAARTYIEKGQKNDFWLNYDLLKLGSRSKLKSTKGEIL